MYASFTGLAIVTVLALDSSHVTAADAFFSLVAGIVGITLAGFVAEIISHLVTHRSLPQPREILTATRIAGGAIASASTALITLALAWGGLLELQIALQASIGIYVLTLGVIALVAAYHSGLTFRQRILAFGVLAGLGSVVVAVLILAH